jgi:hypothetical protein
LPSPLPILFCPRAPSNGVGSGLSSPGSYADAVLALLSCKIVASTHFCCAVERSVICIAPFRYSADPDDRWEVFFAASLWSLEVLHVWHSSSGCARLRDPKVGIDVRLHRQCLCGTVLPVFALQRYEYHIRYRICYCTSA